MRDLAARTAARARRCAARRTGGRGRAAVLLYHRIADPAGRDPWDLAVSPDRFEAHMEMLSSEFRPLPLAELRASRTVPDRAVAVTFDDGYVDNLTHALPVLERWGVPATVFVATNPVHTEQPFW